MGLRVYQVHMATILYVIVVPQRKRHDILRDHISVNFIFQVYIWATLKVVKVGCRNECKPMTKDRTARKFIHHLDQRPVKHPYVVHAFADEQPINLTVLEASQCHRDVRRVRKCNLDPPPYLTPESTLNFVCQADSH